MYTGDYKGNQMTRKLSKIGSNGTNWHKTGTNESGLKEVYVHEWTVDGRR